MCGEDGSYSTDVSENNSVDLNEMVKIKVDEAKEVYFEKCNYQQKIKLEDSKKHVNDILNTLIDCLCLVDLPNHNYRRNEYCYKYV